MQWKISSANMRPKEIHYFIISTQTSQCGSVKTDPLYIAPVLADIPLPWRWVSRRRCLWRLLPVCKVFPPPLSRPISIKLIRHLHHDWFNVAHLHRRQEDAREGILANSPRSLLKLLPSPGSVNLLKVGGLKCGEGFYLWQKDEYCIVQGQPQQIQLQAAEDMYLQMR